ncbi:hypothetical protein [Scleromatobacter humisilvae]|uniref:Uncharacterized protein n=1 Tax=Scleromatobacter humisilvae TaxID=2897159 RepID=A0A9X2C071_9BURK|nr:hypothetical protein [Scleromatobacter humisilvae]MCK9687423.1 hypothetical protein [Scleromatobacter humisilvae]
MWRGNFSELDRYSLWEEQVEAHKIYLIGGDDDEVATIVEHDADEVCKLACSYRGKEVSASASDFFEALCQIRLQLETEGLRLFCYGSSLNVYPSPMARDMGAGRKAYKMRDGRHASISDLVDIFSEGPDVIPASVSQQREFFEQWVASDRR